MSESTQRTWVHGKLRLVLPRDWDDRSSLMFVGPPKKVPEAPLSGRAPAEYCENLVIRVEALPDEVHAPEEYLELVLKSLPQGPFKPQVLSRFPIQVQGSAGFCFETHATGGGTRMRQLMVAAIVEKGVVLFCVGTLEGGGATASRNEMLAHIQSIEWLG